MQKFHRFINFFNIKPGEERVIGLLLLLAFMLELGYVFLQSMAFGVFITEYGPHNLPYSYIAVAIFASLAAVLYIKLGERISFFGTLVINLTFITLFIFLVWMGLRSFLFHYVSFILPLTYQVTTNFGYLVIWQLAGYLFNLQQAKRLFPLIIAGPWLANIVGGQLIEPLVYWLGTTNLLLPVMVLFVLAIFDLHLIFRIYRKDKPSVIQAGSSSPRVKQSAGYFKNRYVLLIFAFITLWWTAFYFLDNIFADQVAAQFPDADQLAVFMGRLLSMTGIVALLTSTLLTSRVIGRFGILAGLLSEALPVTIILGLLVMSASLNAALEIVFVLAALAKLVNVALGFSISQSAYNMLYQPLPTTIRGQVQATAEGIFQPIASGLAGLGLLALTSGWNFTYLGLSSIYLGIAAGLLIIIILLSRGYVGALTSAITKRRLGESPVMLAEPASIKLLQARLHHPHPGVSLYALKLLDNLDSRTVAESLPKLLQHPAPEIRREAFSHIEYLKLRPLLKSVDSQLNVEQIPSVKEAGLRAFAAIADPDSYTHLLDSLENKDTHELRGALIGLLKYKETHAAEDVIHRLIASPSTEDRILAAWVLGEVGQAKFLHMHQILLSDPDQTVRREAIHAAGKSRSPGLYPRIIEASSSLETSRVSGAALTAIGVDVLPDIQAAFSRADTPRQGLLTLSKVVGRIGGIHAQDLLRSRIDSADSELRSHILTALSESGYRAKNPAEIYGAIKMEVQTVTWACAAQADLGDMEATALLHASLRQFIVQSRDRVLLLLSLAFDSGSILRVRESLFIGSPLHLTYTLEIIDTLLPVEWKPMIMPLFEDLSPLEQYDRLKLVFHQMQQPIEVRLQSLIGGSEAGQFPDWIRACAIHTSAIINARSCRELIHAATTDPNRLIRDTACWASDRLSTDIQKGNGSMLSIIEKVLILKTVNMFSQTPDDVLADVANLLEEMEVPENQTIFKKGDPGDSMYIIVDGRVRVHIDDRLLNHLGESDVFGEMALLDPEPRLASVTTLELTQLFRLDQSPFYQLMAERPEIATGIIRVLTRLLRDRVRDLSQLDSRIKELELLQER